LNLWAGIPSVAGIGLSMQPRVEVSSFDGYLSHIPWNSVDQLVTASLWRTEGGSDMVEVTNFLNGNLIANARSGIAEFTNHDVYMEGSVYMLKFSMAAKFMVDDIFTGMFSVIGGPVSRLRVRVQPSIIGMTTKVLDIQPVVEMTDAYGNFNPQALSTTVSVMITPDDLQASPGWRGGSTMGSSVKTMQGVATFSELVLIGIGVWKIDFQAEINFKSQYVSASQNILLINQLESAVVEFVLAMEISSWTADSGTTLLAAISNVCKLDVSALEILDVAAGSVIAGIAIHVPDPTAYYKMIAGDLGSEPSELSNLGVISFSAPGINVALDIPLPPPPPPKLGPYSGIPLDVVDFWTEMTQAFVITGYSTGIGFAIFTEVMASFSGAARISELASPEDEHIHGRRWHTGVGVRSGGAFRSFITQVQFVAALTLLGGRGAQPQFFFTFPEPVDDSAGNRNVHNQSRISDTRLPHGMRTLGTKLGWTNLRSNVTDMFGADLFPRPCDVYAQQVTIGMISCKIHQFINQLLLRSISHT